MKILILTFYFPPDLSAGSFRMKALVEALLAAGGPETTVEVITTQPNRYQSHALSAPELETADRLTIRRISIPEHKSGMLDQSKAFLRYASRVLAETRGGKWDVVLATSSRLMTAALGARVAKRSGVPLYLDIRDLFTDTMSDLLSKSRFRHVLTMFGIIERVAFRAAARVNVVSEGFVPHVTSVAPDASISAFTNGIDDGFLERDFSKPAIETSELPLIVYAGNMGEGQGLHKVVPDAARMLHGKARFRLIGDGGRRRQLENALAAAGLDNVEIVDAMPRNQLYRHYGEADILFMHLNDHAAFRRVLPSKLFEYAATRKPVLAGVAGYAADFLKAELPGVAVFAPCDAAAMAAAVERLLVASASPSRDAFCAKYARKAIMQRMARGVLAVAAQERS